MKYKSQIQSDLYFWVETISGKVTAYCVVSQVDGYPATEACDDWFGRKEDAEEMAKLLAQGKDEY